MSSTTRQQDSDGATFMLRKTQGNLGSFHRSNGTRHPQNNPWYRRHIDRVNELIIKVCCSNQQQLNNNTNVSLFCGTEVTVLGLVCGRTFQPYLAISSRYSYLLLLRNLASTFPKQHKSRCKLTTSIPPTSLSMLFLFRKFIHVYPVAWRFHWHHCSSSPGKRRVGIIRHYSPCS